MTDEALQQLGVSLRMQTVRGAGTGHPARRAILQACIQGALVAEKPPSFLPAAEHEFDLDLDGTTPVADVAPNIVAHGALRVRGQPHENLAG